MQETLELTRSESQTRIPPKIINFPIPPSFHNPNIWIELVDKPESIEKSLNPNTIKLRPPSTRLTNKNIQSTIEKHFKDDTEEIAKFANINTILNEINPLAISIGEQIFAAKDGEDSNSKIEGKANEIKDMMAQFNFNKAFKDQFELLRQKYNDKESPLWAISKEMENLATAFEEYAFIVNKIGKENIYFDNNFKNQVNSIVEDILTQNYTDSLELIIYLKRKVKNYSKQPYYNVKKEILSAVQNPNLTDESIQKILKLELLLDDKRINSENSEEVYYTVKTNLRKIIEDDNLSKPSSVEKIIQNPKSLENKPEKSKWGQLISSARKLFKPAVNLIGAGAIAAGMVGFVKPELIANPNNLAVTPEEVKIATEGLKEQGLGGGQTAKAFESYPDGVPTKESFVAKKVELTPPKLERAPKDVQKLIESELTKISTLRNPSKKEVLNIIQAAKGTNPELKGRLDRAYESVKSKTSLESTLLQLMALGLISIGYGSLLLANRNPKRAPEITNA